MLMTDEKLDRMAELYISSGIGQACRCTFGEFLDALNYYRSIALALNAGRTVTVSRTPAGRMRVMNRELLIRGV